MIGPKIADSLFRDKDKEEMAKGLYQNAILPVHSLIQQDEYDKAVETYYVMTLMLVNYYGLKHEYNEIKDQDYGYLTSEFDPKISGYGMKKIKKKGLNKRYFKGVSFFLALKCIFSMNN